MNRSLLLDTQRNSYYTIPSGLYNILIQQEYLSPEKIKKDFQDTQSKEIIDEYFTFLIDNEIVFQCPKEIPGHYFPQIEMGFDSSSIISNAIIILNSITSPYFETILRQLKKLGCIAVELTVSKTQTIEGLIAILNTFKKYELDDLSLVINKLNGKLNFNELIVSFPFLTSIIIFNSTVDKTELLEDINLQVSFTSKDLTNHAHCGLVSKNYFAPNLIHYTESFAHNTCLNRKLSVDMEGDIKNCPSMPDSFGNIKDTTLLEALTNPKFKKYWDINKDQIEICKDCEFRNICTDCRAFRENPENDLSKPLKCGYNPYTCEWEEWTSNPMKQKAINYYGMSEIIKSSN